MNMYPIGLIVFLSGMFATVAGAPFFAWPAGVAAVAFLYGLVRNAQSKKQAFGAGLLWAMGWQISALYWLPRAFYMDAGNDMAAAIFGGGPAVLGLALYGALGIGAVCALAFAAGPRWRAPAFAGAWVLLEILKSTTPYGFPWLPLGAMLVGSPWLLQLASVGGVFGLSLLILTVAILISSWSYVRYGVAAVLLLSVAMWGGWRLHVASLNPGEDGPTVRVVQPNIQGLHKWEASTRYAYLERTLQVAFPEGLADKKPDVIVLPETAVAFYLDEELPVKEVVAGKLRPGQTLLTGTVRREIPPLARGPNDILFYNSLMAMDATGKLLDVYDKHLLVPFGEVIPFHALLNRLNIPFIRTVSESRLDYAYGTAPSLLVTPAGPVVGLICYEGIFPFYVARWAQNARFLVNITNDNWFTGTIALDQHMALAKLRAVETGKPLVRGANTGISVVVDGYGREVARLPVNQSSLMDVPLPPVAPTPIFAQILGYLL
ncbi:MAG TPA: apolipoprotein N-acyltransferase [Alphaproteobacteria bacterium]|nr:apolipoprotein N-acyltransferase [Alphaproteobacteria bacterium]